MDKNLDARSGSSGVDRSSISAFQAGDPGFKFYVMKIPAGAPTKALICTPFPTQASAGFWIEKTLR